MSFIRNTPPKPNSNQPSSISSRPRTQPRHDPTTSSRLSFNDRAFIEFTRCLHQAKAIVKELESFSASICPAVRISVYEPTALHHDPRLGSEVFIQQVNTYLADTFRKFSRLCKILLMVLTKMQAGQQVKPERIESFRSEVWEEWRIATEIKQNLVSYIQQHVNQFSQPSTNQQHPLNTTTTTSSSSSSTTTYLPSSSSYLSSSLSSSPPQPQPSQPLQPSQPPLPPGGVGGGGGGGEGVGGAGGVGGVLSESITDFSQTTFINNPPSSDPNLFYRDGLV